MNVWQLVIGILLFAFMGAVLYIWGLKKSLNQQSDLTRNLMNNCGNKVVKYLKKHGTVTQKEIADLIRGTSAGQFWSRKKLAVHDPQKVAKEVTAFLLNQMYIESVGKDTYRLKQ